MSAELKRIEKSLIQIVTTLQLQSEELRYLREQIQSIVQVTKPKSNSVVIDPECGYEWLGLHIRLDAATWSRIKAGEHIELRGNGWVPDEAAKPDPANELFYWDYWQFNGGIDKPMRVEMVSPHDDSLDVDDCTAYEGPLLQRFVHVTKAA